jgi:FtsP/CotA-like multicopper oxidase with cupredoxin domain
MRMKRVMSFGARASWASLLAICVGAGSARAEIDGVSGPTFDLYTSPGYIDTPDGNSLLVWGYAVEGQPMQYPGPTLIVEQGQTVTIHLRNELAVPTSLVLPGQSGVAALDGEPGVLAREAAAEGGSVTYTFVASHAGTYLYHSGTRPGVQVEMGLLGALIVRPPTPGRAYAHPDSAFEREHLLLLSEMDPVVHAEVELGREDVLHVGDRSAVLWFINGRNAPDTLSPSRSESPLDALVHPHQQYGALVRLHPGERVLMRVLNAGHDLHPLHTHGNHMRVIARDGRLLQSAPGAGADLAESDFTLQTVPGETIDALWTWTGEGLGWDIYGSAATGGTDHVCSDGDADGFDDGTHEYCPDHGKPVPVVLPEAQSLSFGDFYSGTPFLGALSTLPPGTGGFNLNGGLFFMWHSHNERELANDDIFPGGMMTMAVVEPPGAPIP